MSAANGLRLLLESDAARAKLTRAERMYIRAAVAAAADVCAARMVSDPVNAEFWRRLAGSLRKASAMV